jgi:hypothetical protein
MGEHVCPMIQDPELFRVLKLFDAKAAICTTGVWLCGLASHLWLVGEVQIHLASEGLLFSGEGGNGLR